MKTKQTIITTGAYDSYQIVAIVEGAITPTVPTLYKEFVALYGIWDKPINSSRDVMAKVEADIRAEDTLKKVGYIGSNLGQQFVAWLIHEHGYKRVKIADWHVG